MSEPESADSAPVRAPNAKEVADYLRLHPGFLVDHPNLLSVLTPPARNTGSNVVDMQNFMIERLGREIERIKASQGELIATARGNLSSQSRVHAAVLDIIGAPTFEHLIETVTTDLAVRLDIDVAALCVECDRSGIPAAARSNVRGLDPGTIDLLLGGGYDALLRPNIEADAEVFGAAAGLVRSDALLRLSIGPSTPAALLALGSRQEGRFEPGHGTELLCFLATALECAMRSWLDLPS
ncbi:MAG: DUF484 family protein [Alphaproteobacteria bacterium]